MGFSFSEAVEKLTDWAVHERENEQEREDEMIARKNEQALHELNKLMGGVV